MSLSSLLVGKKPPILREQEIVGSGASASSVVKAVVEDAGGFSRLAKGQVVAIKKVFVPRHSVVRNQRHERKSNLAEGLPGNTFAGGDASSDDDDDDDEDSQEAHRCAAIEREVALLKTLTHQHIVPFYGVIALENRNMLGLVMEYCGGNSLRHYYKKLQQDVAEGRLPRDALHGDGLREDTIQRFTAQMLSGLAYLHANGVVHRDLKGLNVLLNEDYTCCKLADFGSAKQIALSGSDAEFHSMQGTVWWMAPEQFMLGKSGSTKHDCEGAGGTLVADVWSLGCTVLEMALGAIPFTHVAGGQFGLMVLLTRPDMKDEDLFPASVVSKVAPSVLRFVRRCLVREAAKRPSASELLQDEWLSNEVSRISSRSHSPRAVATAKGPESPQQSDVSRQTSCSSGESMEFLQARDCLPSDVPVPDVMPKLQSTAALWFSIARSFDTTISVSDLCSYLRAPSMADIIAPFFAFPKTTNIAASSSAVIIAATTSSYQVDFKTFAMFVSYFGPLELLLDDLWSLEAEKYSSVGYSSYGGYADYEATDGSHLLLSCLSKPYVKLIASQSEIEEELKTQVTGKFFVRYSSRCVESPGSLTLSVKGEHGVIHHRITRPADGWGFQISLSNPSSSGLRRKKIPTKEGVLCFDTVEDLVKYFATNGIPSQRSDRLYKLVW